VDARWRLERIQRLETAYFDLCLDPEMAGSGDHAIVRHLMNRKGDPLAIFRRHETALERTYHRCAKELREAQKIAAEQKRVSRQVPQVAGLSLTKESDVNLIDRLYSYLYPEGESQELESPTGPAEVAIAV
jgi:hypothetical protein